MKKQLIGTAIVAAFTLPFSVAGEDVSAKGIEIVAPSEAECSTREIQPLFTRYARTATQWTLKAGYRSFTDMTIQEARDFDATVMDVELTIPFSERLQARIYFPFDTDGDATHFKGGDVDVDVEGAGGVEDFPSVYFDYQFKKATAPGDSNMAFFVGFGHVFTHLDVTDKSTGAEIEKYNHRGTGVEFGFRMDKQLNNCWSFVANAGLKYIWESDDLNPVADSADNFWHLELGTALIYAPKNAWLYPGIEVLYETQLTPESYSALTIVPEVIIPIGSNVELSAGYGFGFLDGPDSDVRLSLTARF